MVASVQENSNLGIDVPSIARRTTVGQGRYCSPRGRPRERQRSPGAGQPDPEHEVPVALPDILIRRQHLVRDRGPGSALPGIGVLLSPLPNTARLTRLTHQQIRTSRQSQFLLLTRKKLNLEYCLGSDATCTFHQPNTAIVHETLNQACPLQVCQARTASTSVVTQSPPSPSERCLAMAMITEWSTASRFRDVPTREFPVLCTLSTCVNGPMCDQGPWLWPRSQAEGGGRGGMPELSAGKGGIRHEGGAR